MLSSLFFIVVLFYNKHKHELKVAESILRNDSDENSTKDIHYSYLTFLKYALYSLLTDTLGVNIVWEDCEKLKSIFRAVCYQMDMANLVAQPNFKKPKHERIFEELFAPPALDAVVLSAKAKDYYDTVTERHPPYNYYDVWTNSGRRDYRLLKDIDPQKKESYVKLSQFEFDLEEYKAIVRENFKTITQRAKSLRL